jgi:nucleoside-diphosphate-sugar epimerase
MVRPAAAVADFGEGVTVVRGDLRQAGDWRQRLAEADVVVHLAAAVGGDLATQFTGTVVATETLLSSLPANLKRFVHISSFSVYDFRSIRIGGLLDETSPIERRPNDRDAYTWTKIIQEQLVTKACQDCGVSLAVIRPGAIYGPGKEWNFGSALRLGRFDLIFAPFSSMRMTYVDNCADAIAKAVSATAVGVLNIVDAQAPSHAAFHRASRRSGASTGLPIYIPWWLIALSGKAVQWTNRIFFRGGARLPELFDYPRQAARWKPLRYANRRAMTELGWTPAVPLANGVALTAQSKKRSI